jgi:protein TIF31
VLVPKPRFITRDDADPCSALCTTPESDNLELYNSLSLPVTKLDSLHELKQMVIESADGYWLGAVGFKRLLLKINDSPSEGESNLECSGEPSDVLGEYSELSHVFDGPEYQDDKVLRVLKVVEGM